MFENVIAGVDVLDDPQGARDALALAKRMGSPGRTLTLAYVDVVTPRPGPVFERLDSLRDEGHLDARPLRVEARSVAAGLHELAARHDGDLLVVAASRGDEYDRMVAGDETQAVLARAPCAVAVAPRGYATRPPVLKRVGAGYDGSPQSERALALARALATEHGAALSAFEAVREPVFVHDPRSPEPEVDAYVERTRGRIAELGVLEAHAAAGDTDEELRRYGATVDLLVLGAHTYRPIDRLGSGSTAQRLAGGPPCPLLVLSAEG